jgi:hypothetical protein
MKDSKVDVFTSVIEQCNKMEREEKDPDKANFVGMMGSFMMKLMNKKTRVAFIY